MTNMYKLNNSMNSHFETLFVKYYIKIKWNLVRIKPNLKFKIKLVINCRTGDTLFNPFFNRLID